MVCWRYGYDKDSRVTSLVYGTGGSCSLPPNNLGNLTYSYDADGRRTATAGGLAAVTLPANVTGTTSYNADNEQSTFNGTSLSYDANGNLTGDGTNTYTWDARNHLTQITQRRTTVGSFVYDALGRRTNKTVNGTTTQFLYDGLNPVQELNGSNGVVANLLTGLRIDEYFTRTDISTGVTSTLLADALGSTIGLVGSGGTIATNYTYQPFGATTAGGAGNTNTYQFTGRENDGTSLYFYRGRYYQSGFQRFISQDPIGFGGGDTNLYSYVLNQPTGLVDPYGLQEFIEAPVEPLDPPIGIEPPPVGIEPLQPPVGVEPFEPPVGIEPPFEPLPPVVEEPPVGESPWEAAPDKCDREHKKNKRPSTEQKHQEGMRRTA